MINTNQSSNNPEDIERLLTGDHIDALSIVTADFIRAGVRAGIIQLRAPETSREPVDIDPGQDGAPDTDVAPNENLGPLKPRYTGDEPHRIHLTHAALPPGFSIEWGERLIHEDTGKAHISWWSTEEWAEDSAREAPYGGYWRIVGPHNAIAGTNAPDDDHIETATAAEVAAEKQRMSDQ